MTLLLLPFHIHSLSLSLSHSHSPYSATLIILYSLLSWEQSLGNQSFNPFFRSQTFPFLFHSLFPSFPLILALFVTPYFLFISIYPFFTFSFILIDTLMYYFYLVFLLQNNNNLFLKRKPPVLSLVISFSLSPVHFLLCV